MTRDCYPVEGVITKLETTLSQLAKARSASAVVSILRAAAADYGYENVVLARTANGALTGTPLLCLPEGYADTYVASHWALSDPVLREATRSRLPIVWNRLLAVGKLAPAQRRMMEAARNLGVHGGLTVPLHGPGGQCDLVSMSLRDARGKADPARHEVVAMIALQCLVRYLQLTRDEIADGPLSRAPASSRLAKRATQLDGLMSGSPETPFVLPLAHVRALVLVEAGERRWQMGLTALASRIYLDRDRAPIADLERWGLVIDVPDDLRWRYYLTPSVLGRSYLRRCTLADRLRREVWAHEIDRREVPDAIDID